MFPIVALCTCFVSKIDFRDAEISGIAKTLSGYYNGKKESAFAE